jgi:hypothetical protein
MGLFVWRDWHDVKMDTIEMQASLLERIRVAGAYQPLLPKDVCTKSKCFEVLCDKDESCCT